MIPEYTSKSDCIVADVEMTDVEENEMMPHDGFMEKDDETFDNVETGGKDVPAVNIEKENVSEGAELEGQDESAGADQGTDAIGKKKKKKKKGKAANPRRMEMMGKLYLPTCQQK